MSARVRRCIIALPVFGRCWYPQGVIIIDGVKCVFFLHSLMEWSIESNPNCFFSFFLNKHQMSFCSLLVFKALWKALYRHDSAFIGMQLLPTHICTRFQLNEEHQQGGLTAQSVCKSLHVAAVKTRLLQAFGRQQCTPVPTHVSGCKQIMSPQRRY